MANDRSRRNALALQSLGQTLSRNEAIRNQRVQLDNLTKALGSGVTDPRELLRIANQPVKPEKGLRGILNRLAPQGEQPTGAQSSIIQSMLQNALTQSQSPLTQPEQTQAAKVKAGIAPRQGSLTAEERLINDIRGTGETAALTQKLEQDLITFGKEIGTFTESFGAVSGITMTPEQRKKALKLKQGVEQGFKDIQAQTSKLLALAKQDTGRPTVDPVKEEKNLNRDLKIVNNEKLTDRQQQIALGRLRDNQLLGELGPNKDFKGVLNKKDKEKAGLVDKAFGEKAYTNALTDAVDDQLRKGISQESTIQRFNEWWDSKVDAEKGDKFIEFVPREQFQGPDAGSPSRVIRGVEQRINAPDVNLDEVNEQTDFSQLSNEQLNTLLGVRQTTKSQPPLPDKVLK